MRLDSPLPASIAKKLKGLLAPDEEILYSQESDLVGSREFGQSFVIATAKRLAVADRTSAPREILLEDLKELKVDELFGSSRLLAIRKDDSQEILAYYSKVFVPEFGVFCRAVNQILRGHEPELPEEDEPAYCSRCGSPLPDRGISCPKCVSRLTVFKRILMLLRPYRMRAFFLVLFTFGGVLSQMVPPYITKRIVDDVIKGGQYDELDFWIGGMLGSAVLFLLMRYFAGSLNSWLASKLIADIRLQLHDVLQHLKLNYINRRGSGVLVSRIMHDTQELRAFLIEGMPFLMVNILSFVAIAVILMKLDSKLALLVFLPVPFLIVGAGWFWKKLRPLFHRRGSISASMFAAVGETLEGIRVVKAFGQEDRRTREFGKTNTSFFRTDFDINRTFIGFEEVMYWIMRIGVIGVWFFAARRLSAGDPTITLGDLLAFVGYIWLFYGPLQWFTIVMNWMTHAFSSAERIFAILDAPPEQYQSAESTNTTRLKGGIRFDDVRFSYERGKEVIKGISFDVKPGEMIGLVGKSGAGKSTIINLICRFYDVDSGAIYMDGAPVAKIHLPDVRQQIGMVMQETFLFNESILENIRYGTPKASFDDVMRAARAAHAHDFIVDKEDGYDTFIGERGAKLSGGEKQRISIARAILHDPPILILDEATSSVDSRTEKHIQGAIANLVKGRTTIAIAHRLATLRNAHRLFVIDDGRILERGTHDELMEKDGEYAKLVKMQSELSKIKSVVWAE